jgi:predicted ATPase/DNA-binding CsgD family transcriptional regulator
VAERTPECITFLEGVPEHVLYCSGTCFRMQTAAKERAMAQFSPTIQNGILTDLREGSPVQIVVDSSDWYAWLESATTFTFHGEEGRFTAHKERAGHRRGRAYWRAYRKRDGKLHRVYLGQSEELTLERLHSVVVVLAHKEEDQDLLDVPGFEEETRPSSEASSRSRTHQQRVFGAPSPHEEDRSHPWLASLPIPLTTMIGREQEVQAICDLLARPEVHLLTITGTGGVGKTRLALEVSRVVRADFPDGVCFVPLAPVSDPARVIASIAQALGLWEVTDLPPEEQVPAVLRERNLLLLLDNFEHVITAAPQLTRLLASCPLLKILVTSRAALHLSGEHEIPIFPLTVLDLTHLPEPEALSQQASVGLFLLRTQAIQPAFEVTPANARAIAEICVHLDGLPLAIELAAARSKLLAPQALLKRLSHRLEVLTSGAQDLPARQQTLRNTLQWSYDLLTIEEQRLFRWLSIFVGGCTLEAAEAVCQASSEQTSSSVLEGVASLLDKSLVQQTEREGDAPRLVMLETLREFGLACLQKQGELDAARRAHARYYVAFVEQVEPLIQGPEQPLWLARLERDLDNLRTILQAGTSGGEEELELSLRLASALWGFWVGRGHLREGRGFLLGLLARSEASATPVRLKGLITVGVLIWGHSSLDARGLEPIADEALAIAKQQEDQIRLAIAMILRGMALTLEKHDYVTAQVCLEEALTEARASGDPYTINWAFRALGTLALFQQDVLRAVALFEQDLALCRAIGNNVNTFGALSLLARAELRQGHAVRAQTLLEEGLSTLREMGNPWWIALILGLLGQGAFQQGELSQAEAFLTESARLAHEVGDRRIVAQSRLLLGGLAAVQGDDTIARQRYTEGLSIALDIEHTGFIASGLKGLGCVAAAQGMSGWAAVLWGAAEPLRESHSVTIPRDLYERMVALARTQLGEPAFDEARAKGRTMSPAQALTSPESFALQVSQHAQATLGTTLTVSTRRSSSPGGLTTREMEVLRLVAQGLTDAKVAEQLVISPRTVNWHLTSIYSKLGVSSRSAATRYAIAQHLV